MLPIPALISPYQLVGKNAQMSESAKQATAIMLMANNWLSHPEQYEGFLRIEDDGEGKVHLYFSIGNTLIPTPYGLWMASSPAVKKLVGEAIWRGGWRGSDEGGGHVILHYLPAAKK